MEQALFDDLIAACNDAIEYEKGNIHLNSHTVTIPDNEIEANQLFFQQFSKLSELNRRKVIQYTEELLQA
jgi:hypothetical protein